MPPYCCEKSGLELRRLGRSSLYKYGNHLTLGLTKVRSYATFFTSFLAEGLRVRFREIPALNTS